MIYGKLIAALAIIAAFAAWTFGAYRIGGNAPRAELAARVSADKAADDARIKEDAAKQLDTNNVIASLAKEKQDALTNAHDGWVAYNGLLRKSSSASAGGAQSVPVASDVCNDPEANRRLSDAIQGYRVGLRAQLDDFEQRVGQMLELAGVQAADANELKAFLQQGKRINGN